MRAAGLVALPAWYHVCMANENKNMNKLVAEDDDPTAELEALTVRHAFGPKDPELESDANTFDIEKLDGEVHEGVSVTNLKSVLKMRSETIERLQFDIEQLHSKWLGLETEIKSREEVTSNLNSELKSAERELERKEALLGKRELTIKSLKGEIRERENEVRELQLLADRYLAEKTELQAGDEISKAREEIKKLNGQISNQSAELRELEAQQQRTERYADDLRRQLTDINQQTEAAFAERARATEAAASATSRMEALEKQHGSAVKRAEELALALRSAEESHAEELRMLRFELGEAQQTLAENQKVNEELTSDLIDTRGFKDKLENVLASHEETSNRKIGGLEKQVDELNAAIVEYEYKLDRKSEAISCLLAELAKKSQEIDSIGEMEDVIQEIDDRMSERIDDRARAPAERVTRLLVGKIDKQELRFPLFKDRLTIGRTQQNDIQLDAPYISRRHAVVAIEGDATRVIDWGSKNGVYVNSRRVTEHFLKNGDIVTIGTAKFRFEERPKRDV